MVKLRDEIYIDLVLVSGNRRKKLSAIVVGKIKNANAYVILVKNMIDDEVVSVKNRYGHPVRQLELDWGKFFGFENEFIITEEDIIRM